MPYIRMLERMLNADELEGRLAFKDRIIRVRLDPDVCRRLVSIVPECREAMRAEGRGDTQALRQR